MVTRPLNFNTKLQYKDLLLKFQGYTKKILSEVESKKKEFLLDQCKERFLDRIKRRRVNLLKPPLFYEGPSNIRYWIRDNRFTKR